MGRINVFQPTLGDEEAAAVAAVFAGNWLGYGPRAKAFEAEFAAHLGVAAEHTVLINCATSGLFLAIELLELGAGDEVVLPSPSFVAAGNAVLASGARPVFCDVDPATLNPTADHVAAALTPDTKAVLLLHFGGYPGDVAAIARLCRDRGVTLIEDAACAVASRVDGQACGTFGDLAVWSFDAMKMLVTGDGGMLYVRDRELADKARRHAYYGMVESSGLSKVGSGRTARWWDLEVEHPGRRIIGNDVTGAIGSVQLRRLPGFVERRREIAATYDLLLAGEPALRVPPPLPAGHETCHYFYWVRTDPVTRDRLAADLLDAGVYTTFRYPALHHVPLYGATHQVLPGADQAAEETLLLPLHQGLTDADVRHVADAVCRSVSAERATV
ncbi:DegT/DnrJ/EryC1/StrS aminotransferase family protein [Actinophytocola algeriensis]|uniref:Aminotransferase n=1 Tax=Actinophytocola algeriensis TaxID=1768010 RepID=A0A7W7QDK7_9PSEU|nr:DegT/DnrJ/EryC1/StrS family aminotransferase [Actinophytocola algeriensis]MBB4911553.1 aminotransferase [Actinophytocola algeriensis]MBE1473459.1 aminotransferase [Actinophytocola algeriensis]